MTTTTKRRRGFCLPICDKNAPGIIQLAKHMNCSLAIHVFRLYALEHMEKFLNFSIGEETKERPGYQRNV